MKSSGEQTGRCELLYIAGRRLRVRSFLGHTICTGSQRTIPATQSLSVVGGLGLGYCGPCARLVQGWDGRVCFPIIINKSGMMFGAWHSPPSLSATSLRPLHQGIRYLTDPRSLLRVWTKRPPVPTDRTHSRPVPELGPTAQDTNIKWMYTQPKPISPLSFQNIIPRGQQARTLCSPR